MPYKFALVVENIECHFVLRRALEVIINHRARGRIFADWLTLIKLSRIIEKQRGLRLIENEITVRHLQVYLAQWRKIIEHPERATVGRGYQIIVLHDEIVNR